MSIPFFKCLKMLDEEYKGTAIYQNILLLRCILNSPIILRYFHYKDILSLKKPSNEGKSLFA
jgi:hypothetical protein